MTAAGAGAASFEIDEDGGSRLVEVTAHRAYPDPGGRAGRTAPPMHGDADCSGCCRPGMLRPVGSDAVVAGATDWIAKHGIGVQHLRQVGLGRATEFLGDAVLTMGIGMELAQPPPVSAGQLADLGGR